MIVTSTVPGDHELTAGDLFSHASPQAPADPGTPSTGPRVTYDNLFRQPAGPRPGPAMPRPGSTEPPRSPFGRATP